MYNLFYWKYSPQLMCTFSNYEDCKKALEKLKETHPDSQIWYESVSTINSYEEWKDKFNEGANIYR